MRFKKILVVLLALALMLGILASCGKKDETPADTTAKADSTTAKPEEPDEPGEDEEEIPDVPRPSAPAIPEIANPNSLNETRTLTIQESTFDGIVVRDAQKIHPVLPGTFDLSLRFRDGFGETEHLVVGDSGEVRVNVSVHLRVHGGG